MFIALEGPDGIGKTTMAGAIAEALGATVVDKKAMPAEPSWARGVMAPLRQLIWPGGEVDHGSELPRGYWLNLKPTWFALAHEYVVGPALAVPGSTVLLDGWTLKSRAQSVLDGIDEDVVRAVYSRIPEPDLTIYLIADLDAIFTRRSLTSHEMGGHHFSGLGVDTYRRHQTSVIETCLRLVPADSLVVVELDARADADACAARVVDAVRRSPAFQRPAAGTAVTHEPCPHCPPFRQPLVLSTPSTLARLAQRGRRTNPGYTVVTTRRHAAGLADLAWHELVDLSSATVRVAAGLCAVLGATKVTVRMNWGPPGQHAPHLHLHLVPRFPGDGHDGFLPGPLEDLTSQADADLFRRLRPHLPEGSTSGGTPTPVTCELRRHPIDETAPGRPCASVVVPSDGERGSGVGLASALLAITPVAREVIGTGRVTGLTIRLAAGPPEPSPNDATLVAYPRWPEDGFVTPDARGLETFVMKD